MHIRQAQLQDAQVVVNLIQMLAQAEGETSPISPDYLPVYLAYPGCHILIAEDAGEATGLASYSVRPDLYHAGNSCLIETLIVRDDRRGRGVGRALVRAIVEQGRAEQWAEISVSTLPENKRAIDFYRRQGFTDEAVLLETHLEHSPGVQKVSESRPN